MGIAGYSGLFTLLVILASVGLVGVAALIVHALDRGVKLTIAKLKMEKEGTADRGSPKNRYASAAAPNQLGENCGVPEESTTTDVVDNKEPANCNYPNFEYEEPSYEGNTSPCYRSLADRENDTEISKTKAGVHSQLESQIRKTDLVYELNLLRDRLDVAELDANNCLNELDVNTKPRVQNLESNALVLAKEISQILTIIERLTEMALEGEKDIEALESLTPVIGSHGERIENLETAEKMWLHANPLDNRLTEVEDKLADSIFILYGGKKPDGEV